MNNLLPAWLKNRRSCAVVVAVVAAVVVVAVAVAVQLARRLSIHRVLSFRLGFANLLTGNQAGRQATSAGACAEQATFGSQLSPSSNPRHRLLSPRK